MTRWWPERVPLRLRVFFRGAFLLLALATLALALSELREERRLSYRSYRDVFEKNVEQISARLQHPSGQLALLNPQLAGAASVPLHPLVLPFSAIDFDDRAKAQQAAEMAGCLVQYPDRAQLCVAVGNNPVAGGYIYAVGSFASGPLVPHVTGDPDLQAAHRLRVEVAMRGQSYQWLAPLELETEQRRSGVRGRLPGFATDSAGNFSSLPDHDFRGWLWQDGRCLDTTAAPDICTRRSFFSVRLPVELFHAEFDDSPTMVWPPRDLGQIRVRIRAFGPGSQELLFDSNRAGAAAPFALADLRAQLLKGETLRIRRLDEGAPAEVITLVQAEEADPRPARLLSAIVRRLPVEGYERTLTERRIITTPVGDFELTLSGDLASVDRGLAVVAGRLSLLVLALLAAIVLTWIAIELRIIHRITVLTRRAASVNRLDRAPGEPEPDFEDLRSSDELGLLAGVLSDLLQRVQEDARREQIRAEQARTMWHAVGHEIMAPLQSLAALHGGKEDPGLRYIERMRQAVRVLYGSASPSEAIGSATLQVSPLRLQRFLATVAANAVHAGIVDVSYTGPEDPLEVSADEYSLEDVITHVLSNANRHRTPRSTITMTLARAGDSAEVRIRNLGPPIETALLERIFDYGVSGHAAGAQEGRLGQGLYVARTYMAKMGGTIVALNTGDGVEFVLTLALA
jgi:signal transduction histidine kinase